MAAAAKKCPRFSQRRTSRKRRPSRRAQSWETGGLRHQTPSARVQTSYQQLGDRGDALATAFYAALFGSAPELRRVFPDDMTSLKRHFDAALALIISNLDSLGALEPAIRDLGASTSTGARGRKITRLHVTRS